MSTIEAPVAPDLNGAPHLTEPDETAAPVVDRIAELEKALADAEARLHQREEDTLELRESRHRIKELALRSAQASEAAKRTKKAYETALEDHLELEERLDGQPRLPFTATLPEAETTREAAPATVEDESWRLEPIGRLADFGLSVRIVEKLIEAGIPSMSELADWTAAKPLTDIPGIGQAKAEKIADATERFWAARKAVASTDTLDRDLTDACNAAEAEDPSRAPEGLDAEEWPHEDEEGQE